MIKACIFDLDGTLAYTLDSMAVVGNEVVRKYGLKPMPIENYRYYCGNGADMLVKRLLVDAGDSELLHYEEAKAYFLELMMSTDGEEHERAECVYIQLMHGLDECSDED